MPSRRQSIQAGVFEAVGLPLGDMLRLEGYSQQSGTQALTATGSQKDKPPAKALSVTLWANDAPDLKNFSLGGEKNFKPNLSKGIRVLPTPVA